MTFHTSLEYIYMKPDS